MAKYGLSYAASTVMLLCISIWIQYQTCMYHFSDHWIIWKVTPKQSQSRWLKNDIQELGLLGKRPEKQNGLPAKEMGCFQSVPAIVAPLLLSFKQCQNIGVDGAFSACSNYSIFEETWKFSFHKHTFLQKWWNSMLKYLNILSHSPAFLHSLKKITFLLWYVVCKFVVGGACLFVCFN